MTRCYSASWHAALRRAPGKSCSQTETGTTQVNSIFLFAKFKGQLKSYYLLFQYKQPERNSSASLADYSHLFASPAGHRDAHTAGSAASTTPHKSPQQPHSSLPSPKPIRFADDTVFPCSYASLSRSRKIQQGFPWNSRQSLQKKRLDTSIRHTQHSVPRKGPHSQPHWLSY